MKTFSSKEKKHLSVQKKSETGRPGYHAERARQTEAVRQILGGPRLQAKLKINAPNDSYEQEADRVADAVMRMPAEALQRQPLEEEEKMLQAKPADPGANCPDLQRQVEEKEEEEFLQPKRDGDRVEVTPELESGISSSRGDGRPLSEKDRTFFEPRMGLDLGNVKVYTGSQAADLTHQINARAFTLGSDIYFGAGQYSPESFEGKKLLAHELAHVIQQSTDYAKPEIVQRQSVATGVGAGGLSQEWLHQIARVLYQAMKGPGTDEEAIYSAFSGRTQAQVDAIARVYKENYRRNLLADLKDELTGSEMEHLAIFSPTAASGAPGSAQKARAFADMVAAQLNRAMDRTGTDEEAIYAALTGRIQAEIDAIKAAYKRLTKRELEADIRDEMSGEELKRALFLLNQNANSDVDNVRLHLFTDIDEKDLGLGDVLEGRVGHTWISLEYKDPTKVPATVHPDHEPLLRTGGKYSDPMGFWPAINENIYYSDNPFASWVKGWMRHPDRAHEGSEKATETWNIDDKAVPNVIRYAESKRTAKYSVFFYNCTTFAKEAIESTGHSTPSMKKWGFAMPNAVYDGIKERQEKGLGRTSVKEFGTGKEQLGVGPDELRKKR